MADEAEPAVVEKLAATDVEAPSVPVGPYAISCQELDDMNANKDLDTLQKYGGVTGLAKALCADLANGLEPAGDGSASVEQHREVFGANKFKEAEAKGFWSIVYENMQDPIIILLIAAAAVSTGLGAGIPEERAHNGWIEGVAIWVAVFAVTMVGAVNDYQKDQQFRKLNAQKDTIDIKVQRGGHTVLVKNHDIVCGDVMILDTGDKIIADGILFETHGLVVDEASLTGESDPIKKKIESDPWCRSGTTVNEGSGKVIVSAVGTRSEWGRTMELVATAGDDATPLQEKLEVLASAIGKVGLGVAVSCFIVLLIKWCVLNRGFPIERINDDGPVQFFLYAVTIIVMAIPEGLPLAVTISLAYSMKKMMKDNNFVRVLAACETMGGCTNICSDKTGTLTENRMTVTEGWFAGKKFDVIPAPGDISGELLKELQTNIALNSKAFLMDGEKGKTEFVGNRTECALLMLMRAWGEDYIAWRNNRAADVVQLFGFSSARKMASVLVKREGKYRNYNKGAAEWVLKLCTSVMTESGASVPLSDAAREELYAVVTAMASRGLRCICLSYVDWPVEGKSAEFFQSSENLDVGLTAMAIVGIKDPVRKEVPDAVYTCQTAGITVRMVTGDNIHTAKHIARECGILTDEGIALEGPVFRAMPDSELLPLLPNLQVLARSSPEDKLMLVRKLKGLGNVVAVTGDGTNDAPALKESDVGLAMGIAGTEVAKEAADIVILDDNFSSIVKSVLWGRSVFNNIRKFLQFQITVNFVALVTAFIGAIVGGRVPLNVLQLLWVNLIMDTLGALALATEDPTMALLHQKPHGRGEPLINRKMWKHILAQGLYQIFCMLFCLYGLPELFDRYAETPRCTYYLAQCATVAAKVGLTGADATNACGVGLHCGYSCKHVPASCPAGLSPGDRVTELAALGVPLAKYNSLMDTMGEDLEDQHKIDLRRSTSMLFNVFIFCQVFNEINCRRINHEYNVFENFFQSPVFISVIVVTAGLQAIIINFLGIFFKVVPLDWIEWLVCIGFGAFSLVVSLVSRFFFRLAGASSGIGAGTNKVVPAPHSGKHDIVDVVTGEAPETETAAAPAEGAAVEKAGQES